MTPEDKAVKLAEVDSRSKSNMHRLDTLEQRQAELEDLVAAVKVLALRMEHTESALKNIETDLKEIKGRPGKRWEGIVDKALQAIFGAIAGALVGAALMFVKLSGG